MDGVDGLFVVPVVVVVVGSVGFSPLGFCWALCFGVGVSRAEAQATGEVGYGCGRLRLVVVGAFFEV